MSFGAVADDYDRLRPPPPPAAIDWLVPPGCRVAVDLAAGTGLLSRALSAVVPEVIAVEPDERMADVLRARSPGVRVLPGRGESIPLPDASADGVFISSAWHWLDPELAPAEIARVLGDGGRLGLIWTSRDRQVDWMQDLDGARGRDRADRPAGEGEEKDKGEGEARTRGWRREVSVPEELFTNAENRSFTFVRPMSKADLVAMLGTYSGVITASPQERAEALAGAEAALERRFPGVDRIDVPMRTWCWRAGRVTRARA